MSVIKMQRDAGVSRAARKSVVVLGATSDDIQIGAWVRGVSVEGSPLVGRVYSRVGEYLHVRTSLGDIRLMAADEARVTDAPPGQVKLVLA